MQPFLRRNFNMKKIILGLVLAFGFTGVQADDTKFSTNLHAKFHQKACLTCHQFNTKSINGGGKGLGFSTHFARKQQKCETCHTAEVTGMKDGDWLVDNEIDYTGLGPKETCEFIKATHHGKINTPAAMTSHLLTDPRILWAIQGGLPSSGNLPFGKKAELISGDMAEWTKQVTAWVGGGMKCE